MSGGLRPDELFTPLRLRSGQVLSNRIAKAAMEEGMAGPAQLPDGRLNSLYRRWGAGGAGLLITGNVMVHAHALTGPAGIVLDADSPLEPFEAWARAGKENGASMWMQISHPGRQVRANMPGVVWGPSDIGVDLGRRSKRFGQPVAMNAWQIHTTIGRFATTARSAERAGFDGVEVHAAHGYLLSQFLSPLVNNRTDEWGGSLQNRARLLLEIVHAIRSVVSPRFAVAVKLNSADFQRGGFGPADAQTVIGMLATAGTDLVEISGGNYESPAMSGRPADGRVAAREAYFLDLAANLARTSVLPLMLTGGISRRTTAQRVLGSKVALIGMATALAITPDLPHRWRRGAEASRSLKPVNWTDKALAAATEMAMVRYQMRRMATGAKPALSVSPTMAMLADQRARAKALRRYSRWLAAVERDEAPVTSHGYPTL
ncbi:NADH:flavin oxidoreductase/NADH oxidase family protein [Nocardia caishijiensis]|uniref:2,4-dienoyl-CoA reductase-like NADH-dependent reductase (Old Yellow Enzyme family) n=1 Tax=Nocardia caishijiensis TaxID=184756 RepID=A0ABQ6YIB7_9NOCA|nr:NADH:flavin oxidoreductase/NADH oxidase family protein [Nocardia caishijiensis]KAF0845206.1 2,4-dienoyl-CoA reductase-like NADH-dependent reductase (Old Yellow Enzyme family) [Nocardia caishijiensis]